MPHYRDSPGGSFYSNSLPRPERHPGPNGHDRGDRGYWGHIDYGSDRRYDHQRRRWSRSSDGHGRTNPCSTCSNAISNRMERAFYWLGKKVATYPIVFMAVSAAIAGAFGSGVFFLKEEARQEVLWLPTGSPGERHFALSQRYFPSTLRLERAVFVDSNILRADIIKAIFQVDKNIKALNDGKESSWESVCVRLGSKCWSNSLLEVWNFDEAQISALTDESVLDDINTVTTSPYFGGPFAVGNYLGGVVRDNNGRIMSATSTVMSFFTVNNETEVDGNKIYIENVLDFEKEFIDLLLKGHEGIKTLYFYAQRSYDDVFAENTNSEARILLGVGYGIMGIFVVIVIGKFNRLEHRIYLAGGGMLSVGLALLVAMGGGTYMGFFYGPIQNILALLLLGVGVDDMFVITHAIDRLPREVLEKASPAEQVAQALRHAGVSITVTSITDIIAFAVGASTILPALRSFCVYCALGLFAMYLLLITFFIGCLALDRKRVQRSRDACLCCVVLDYYWEPAEWSRKSLMSWFFKRVYSRIITHVVTKVIVILVALGLAAGAGYGLYHVEVKTDFARLFPDGTYAREYLNFVLEEYPDDGTQVAVYFIDVDYYGEKTKLDKVHTDLENDFHIRNGSISSWYQDFVGWLKIGPISDTLLTTTDGEPFPKDEDTFYILLEQFLTSAGARYQGSSIKTYTNSDSKMRVRASRINMQHSNVGTTDLEIRAVARIRTITADAGLGQDNCFPYGLFYPVVATNIVIKEELFRNLGLAFVCVAIVTLPLIASLGTCIFVCITVVLTLVDVAGGMYFLDISIDIVSSLTLILTIGLSVDYSAHVGNTFMTKTGTRNERVRATVESIGTPVFLGGFSTFLALAPLLFAKSFVLHTFFTLFTAIVVVGLFHGLALLPVLLSLMGPAPYSSAYNKAQSSETYDDGYKRKRPKMQEPFQEDMDRGWRHRDHQRDNSDHRHSSRHRDDSRRYDRHSRHDAPSIWHTDSNGHREEDGKKKRLFYYDPRYERPVPIYNGRPAVRPPPQRDYIGHSMRRSYDERHKSRHHY